MALPQVDHTCKHIRVIRENQREAAGEGRRQVGVLHACDDVGLIDNGVVVVQESEGATIVRIP